MFHTKTASRLRRFLTDKSGAVTVDWVALTAAVVVIGIALVYAIFGADGITALVNNFQGELAVASGNIDGHIENTPLPFPLTS